MINFFSSRRPHKHWDLKKNQKKVAKKFGEKKNVAVYLQCRTMRTTAGLAATARQAFSSLVEIARPRRSSGGGLANHKGRLSRAVSRRGQVYRESQIDRYRDTSGLKSLSLGPSAGNRWAREKRMS